MFITIKEPYHNKQLTIDDILFGNNATGNSGKQDPAATRTVWREKCPNELRSKTNVAGMVQQLKNYCAKYRHYIDEVDLSGHYYEFQIPKKSGGLRTITAPDDDLKKAQAELIKMLQGFMIADHHTNAFAYVEERSHVSAVQKHAAHRGHWVVKFDFSGFFPSTNFVFVWRMLAMQYPFALIMEDAAAAQYLADAMQVGFVNGHLVMGTPFSPGITNIMMIPFDHDVSASLRSFAPRDGLDEQRFIYTRYSDDITVSCVYDFDFRRIEQLILNTLRKYQAPFMLNKEKTHYGSTAGHNWCLGLMWNKDNNVTLGHRRKKYLKAAINNYICDHINGKLWSLEDIKTLGGNISYLKQVEPDSWDVIMKHFNTKYHVDVKQMMHDDEVNFTTV